MDGSDGEVMDGIGDGKELLWLLVKYFGREKSTKIVV